MLLRIKIMDLSSKYLENHSHYVFHFDYEPLSN